MSDEELKAFSLQPLTLNIPSNTVLTECSIRDMDNLSLAITSQEKQDIMIIALEESCKNKIKKKENSSQSCIQYSFSIALLWITC